MIRWLDRVTGLITMYRLVLFALLALGIEALLLSLTGAIPYNALAIIVTGVVSVFAAYASNRLFALLFRVHPHSESSVITGLILLFLFNPRLDFLALVIVAVAAVIAMLSKYLIAVRGRHLFNPAAFGAFVTTLVLPQNFPGWWVGSPWLLPLVVLGALVILFRTRHLTMGLVFFVIATLSVTLTLTSFGSSVGTAIVTALTSYPIVYFAGFMLSEPLTLPPRRWQQLVLAVVVGALFGLSFHVGPLIWTYQLALLIGNLLAFFVGQRRAVRLEYLGREPLNSNSWSLAFAPKHPVRFSAGQYMELTLPHAKQDTRGLRRTFSIASPPSTPEVIRFGVRTTTGDEVSSSFKNELLALQPGTIVAATSVGGDFVLPRDASRPVLLVAGGIGITPFMSQLAELRATGDTRDVVLVYAASSADDLAYATELDAGGHRVLLVAPTAPAHLPTNFTWIGRGPLTVDMLLAAVPDARDRDAYVSGPPGLVHGLTKPLRKAGVHRVHTDYFSGY